MVRRKKEEEDVDDNKKELTPHHIGAQHDDSGRDGQDNLPPVRQDGHPHPERNGSLFVCNTVYHFVFYTFYHTVYP